MENKFDYIIVGAGCAGLSLAYAMSNDSFFDDKKILLIDKDTKNSNDRTWCFWADNAFGFEEIVFRKWDKIAIQNHYLFQKHTLKTMSYQFIRGIDFYIFIQNKLATKNNITFLQDEIKYIDDNMITTDKNGTFSANLIFDSISMPKLSPNAIKYIYLHQHFKGWRVRTKKPIFKPDEMTMFDFRYPQGDDMRFFYILPFSENEALVEFTVFGKELFEEKSYDLALQFYFHTILGDDDYEILEIEKGVIPMTNYHFKRMENPFIYKIGTAGGMCKPSTGYAFVNIQKDTQKMIQAIKTNKSLNQISFFDKRFMLYDSMLLDIFRLPGFRVSAIFMILFANNNIENVLKFLVNETNFVQELRIMASVPPLPFLISIKNLLLRKLFHTNL